MFLHPHHSIAGIAQTTIGHQNRELILPGLIKTEHNSPLSYHFFSI